MRGGGINALVDVLFRGVRGEGGEQWGKGDMDFKFTGGSGLSFTFLKNWWGGM